MNKLNLIADFVVDVLDVTEKSDYLKEFFQGNDEFLSASSWGNLVKYFVKRNIQIKDINEAYYFTLYTTYLNTFQESLEYYSLEENNFSMPNRKYIKYNYNEFKLEDIISNKLKLYFDEIFQTFLKEDDKVKIQRYINNNIKYNYFKVLSTQNFVLNIYIEHINSKLGKEEQNNFDKDLYTSKIEKEYFDITLSDKNGLSLNELYIEPYFRVHKSCFSNDEIKEKEYNKYDSKYVDVEDESIHRFIENILTNKNRFKLNKKNVNTIFIAGQPGQGKSSFTKRFCNDIINNKTTLEQEVILIKLKDIEEPKDLLNKDIKCIVKEELSYGIDSLENYIVVFDGLDELAMKTGLSISDIDTICHKISRSDITAIVTTRHGYVNFDILTDKNIIIVELKELNEAQQLSWLKEYKKFNNVKFDKNVIETLHKEEEKNKHILELINQAILLHMIVDMDIENIANISKSKLYKKFFYILINRKWEKEKHTLTDGINEDDYTLKLMNMLKELAFEIYNSDFEYIHKNEFKKLKRVNELQILLSSASNNETLKSNLKGMMVSFYFKEVKKDNQDNENIDDRSEDYAIEFLHKSLMEYILALNIYETIKDEFLDTRRSGEYIINDGESALSILWKLLSNKQISNEIKNNLIEIIKEDIQDDKDKLAQRFDEFLPYFIEKDFLFENKIGEANPIKKSENTFYGFWNILSSLDDKNHMPDNLELKEQLFNKINIFCNSNNLNLSNCNLSNINLDNAIIINGINTIDFRNSRMFNCNIWYIKKGYENNNLHTLRSLSHSNIERLLFMNCNFKENRLYNVVFNSCQFKNIIFNSELIGYILFDNCKFNNCQKIDFKDLKEKGAIFINCTNDGEEI